MHTVLTPPLIGTAAEYRGRAMGTRLHVIVVAEQDLADQLAAEAVASIADLERRWSRFLVGSEVSGIARHAGRWVGVSAATIDLVEHAVLAWRLTHGRFDPTVDVAALGYDRTFDDLARPIGAAAPGAISTGVGALTTTGAGARRTRCGDIEIDRERLAVRVPDGVTFDPGGIGKGLAADRVTAELVDAGATGAMVNLGGDLRVRGTAPSGGAWGIEVREPAHRSEPIARLALHDGGVATSTSCRRRWTDQLGIERHHVIDPISGVSTTERPADVVVATAIAGSGWWAEAAATASIGRPTAALPDVHLLTSSADGDVRRSPDVHRFEP